MSERTVRGGIQAGPTDENIEQDIDPELVDDRDVAEKDTDPVELPDYDPTQFELPDDYEYSGGDED